MAKINNSDYLFLSTRVRGLEAKLLTQERMTRMLEAKTAEEAAQVLVDCGYPELQPLTLANLYAALSAEQRRVYEDFAPLTPDPALLDVFKVRYDYHNVKVILKATATQNDPEPLLMDLGRVPIRELLQKTNASDLRGLPPLMQTAIQTARETLGTTRDPQLADLILDRACYAEMFHIAETTGSAFLAGYVRICIDSANLRTAVRTIRMGKQAEFLRDTLFSGGNYDSTRVLAAAASGGSLAELFSLSPLREAAEIGATVIKEGRLTQFEKLCDNAVTQYLKKAKLVPYGEAPVIAYLASKETELTAIRIILTGRMADIPVETIQERLRDAYV